MFLPYADAEIVRIATDALEGNLFRHDLTDQFLSMAAMDWQAEYDGDSDYGNAVIMSLDAETNLILTILDDIASDGKHDAESPFNGDGWVILWGSTHMWWGQAEYFATEELARVKFEEFSRAYAETFEDEDDDTDDEPTPGGLLDEIRQAENVLGTE